MYYPVDHFVLCIRVQIIYFNLISSIENVTVMPLTFCSWRGWILSSNRELSHIRAGRALHRVPRPTRRSKPRSQAASQIVTKTGLGNADILSPRGVFVLQKPSQSFSQKMPMTLLSGGHLPKFLESLFFYILEPSSNSFCLMLSYIDNCVLLKSWRPKPEAPYSDLGVPPCGDLKVSWASYGNGSLSLLFGRSGIPHVSMHQDLPWPFTPLAIPPSKKLNKTQFSRHLW